MPDDKTKTLELHKVLKSDGLGLDLLKISDLLKTHSRVKVIEDFLLPIPRNQNSSLFARTSTNNNCKYELKPVRFFSTTFTPDEKLKKINIAIKICPNSKSLSFSRIYNYLARPMWSGSIESIDGKPDTAARSLEPYQLNLAKLPDYIETYYSFEDCNTARARIDINLYQKISDPDQKGIVDRLNWKSLNITTEDFWHHLDANFSTLLILQPENLIVKDEVQELRYFLGEEGLFEYPPGGFYRGCCFFLKVLQQTANIKNVSYQVVLSEGLRTRVDDALDSGSENKNEALIKSMATFKVTLLEIIHKHPHIKIEIDVPGCQYRSPHEPEAATRTSGASPSFS